MNRFATRDQENLVHTHQTALATKQINQKPRGLPTKTPIGKQPKTPVRVALNNENAPLQNGKSVLKTIGKGNENATGKGFGKEKFEKKQPYTPKGPLNRAPLGNKTTNAKAKAYQTPVQPKSDNRPVLQTPEIKSRSPRLRRAKVKVYQPAPTTIRDDDSEPEIEYMPPKPNYLPDHPDDEFPAEMDYPQLKGPNLTRGWYETYAEPNKCDSKRAFEPLQAEELERLSREQDEVLRRSCENISFIEEDLANFVLDEDLLESLC